MVKPEVKKPRAFRSLTVTLTIAFFTLVAIILIIVGALTLYFHFAAQQKFLAAEQHHIAHDAANTVKGFVQEKLSVLEAAVSVGGLANIPKGEEKLVLDKLMGLKPAFRQLILFNTQEQELVKVSRLSGFLIEQLTEQIMEQFGKEMFSQVSQKKTYISQVYIDEISQEPMVIMAVPVKDAFGDFKGTLMGEINLKFMWDLVASIKIGEKGLAYVVDRRGNLIAFGDVSRVLKGENLTYLAEVDEFVKGDILTHKSSAEISRGIQGKLVVANHAHLENPDWAVVVELPVSEAYASLIRQIIISAVIILSIFGSAIWTVIYLSKRITKPIIKLRDLALEIGKGKLDTKIEIISKDEIGQLALTFNEMAAKLKASYEYLEEKVKERTKELDAANQQLKASGQQLRAANQQLVAAQKQLQEKVSEMERFHKLTIGREEKILELKERIREIEEQLKTTKSGSA